MKSSPHFFIFGYFGWFNVGDDAIGLSLIKELKDRYPDATLTITSNDGYFVENFCGTCIKEDLEIIGFELSSILWEITKSDYFIITGGTHFHDEDGLNYGRLKILLSFVMLTSYARLFGKSPFLLGHGVGSLSSLWSRCLVKVILNNCKKVFVRDASSFELVSSLGFYKKCLQGFDCTATMINPKLKINVDLQQKNQKIIGISILPAFTIYSNNAEKDMKIAKSLACCLNKILQNNNSLRVHLFAFRTGTKHSDIPLLNALIGDMKAPLGDIKLIQYDGNVEKFLNLMDECDYYIGMRYHASLFAYLFHKPQIILDYMSKCNSLGQDIAIEETAIVPILNILKPEFCSIVQSLLRDPGHFVAMLPLHSAKMRAGKMFSNLDEEL